MTAMIAKDVKKKYRSNPKDTHPQLEQQATKVKIPAKNGDSIKEQWIILDPDGKQN